MFSTADLEKKSIGIYWGTFDPPTLAHADIIEKSLSQFNLAKVIVVLLRQFIGVFKRMVCLVVKL
jgi:cytidyltransferase-like protein